MGSPVWQGQGAPGAAELMDDQGTAEHRENEEMRQYQENKATFLAAALFPARGWGVLFSAPKHTAQTKSIKGVNTKWQKKCVCATRQGTAGSTSSS